MIAPDPQVNLDTGKNSKTGWSTRHYTDKLGCHTPIESATPIGFHHPFVSPEFSTETEHEKKINVVSTGRSSTRSNLERVQSTTRVPGGDTREYELELVAPPYTVRASVRPHISPPVAFPNPNPQLLAKHQALASTSASSRRLQSSTNELIPPGPASMLIAKHALNKADKGDRDNESGPRKVLDQGDLEKKREVGESRPQTICSEGPPRDLSNLIFDINSTWGDSGLKKHLLAREKITQSMNSTTNKESLSVTTGLFPQTIHLSFSCPVSVSSIHLRTRAVHRLSVHRGRAILGNTIGGAMEEQRVSVMPNTGVVEEWGDSCEDIQEVKVDVRGIPSFEHTRTLSITLEAGNTAFCGVARITCLGYSQ